MDLIYDLKLAQSKLPEKGCQAILQTCKDSGRNIFDYLTILQSAASFTGPSLLRWTSYLITMSSLFANRRKPKRVGRDPGTTPTAVTTDDDEGVL